LRQIKIYGVQSRDFVADMQAGARRRSGHGRHSISDMIVVAGK